MGDLCLEKIKIKPCNVHINLMDAFAFYVKKLDSVKNILYCKNNSLVNDVQQSIIICLIKSFHRGFMPMTLQRNSSVESQATTVDGSPSPGILPASPQTIPFYPSSPQQVRFYICIQITFYCFEKITHSGVGVTH